MLNKNRKKSKENSST